jgi:protein-S-isoprenylcysteine O-methyltransferase Ste14
MKILIIKTFAGFFNLLVILGLTLFLSAWTFDFWEAWVYLAVFFIPVLLITIYFLKTNPDLIGRRLKVGPTAETRISQKILQSMASLFFISIFIVPGFDHRFHWSNVPTMLILIADSFVLLGFLIVFYVFKENSYTSAIVEINAEQKVISSGLYAIVRHPMYSGALLLLLFTPIALGSWWALFFFIPMLGVIILRLLDEEKLLNQSLLGYTNYCQKVHYRLIPYIW